MEEIRQTAKHNIETHYSVVGLTAHMKSTFKLFEAFLPKFFYGASKFVEETEEKDGDNFNSMVNHYGRNISEKVLNTLMDDPYMEVDSDVYLFVSRRFHLQLNYVLDLEENQKQKMK